MRVSGYISGGLVAIVVTVAALSCSKFSYHEPQYEESYVHVEVDGDSEIPCRIMMSRLVNACHYVWEVDTLARPVGLGEYYAVAYRADDQYEISNENEFANDPSVSMQDVYAVLPPDKESYGRISDFNPYSSFISPADGLLEFDFKKVSVADTATYVTFSPKSLTQDITFRLKVKAGQGVTVEKVSAAISGVPSKVRLLSGMLRNDAQNPTFRQFMNMTQVNGSDMYEGSISVLGLFPPLSSQHTTGPGIFQVALQAVVAKDGKDYERVFYAAINLKSVIEKAGLMEQTEDMTGYRIRKSEAIIEIPVVLHVSADKVIPGDGEGLEQWFENDADIEVEV